jgi:hypothetical protein
LLWLSNVPQKQKRSPARQALAKDRNNFQNLNQLNMAKVLFTAVVADMRNKLNGTVFSKNRYGGYTRTKVTPVNPQTTSQQNARNRLSTASQAWRGLSEAERQSWIDAAPNFPFTDIFGNTKILSGQALYVKLNANLALVGEAAIAVAPSPVAIPEMVLTSVTADDSANTVIIAGTTPVPADFALVVLATPNVTPGISFVKNKFRFVDALAAAATSPYDISAAYVALFGDPVLDQKIFVRCFFISTITGQAGIPVQAQTIVVA